MQRSKLVEKQLNHAKEIANEPKVGKLQLFFKKFSSLTFMSSVTQCKRTLNEAPKENIYYSFFQIYVPHLVL